MISKKECVTQEALGILKRWKVTIYHDRVFKCLPIDINTRNKWDNYTREIYKIVYVFAPRAEAACIFVSNKYNVKELKDHGIIAEVYHKEPFPTFVTIHDQGFKNV